MQNYNVMSVGDFDTGRTCLNIAFIYRKFPKTYIPSVCDRESRELKLEDGRTVQVTACEDGSKGEDYDRLRPLSYLDSDVFLAFYSVELRQSFESLKSRWIPEVRDYRPSVPIIIVANKIDLRRDGECETVSYDEGLKLAHEMGTSYHELSCLELTGIDECFTLAVELAELNTKLMKRRLQTESVIIPPIKPAPVLEPIIKSAPSTFGDDCRQMMSCPKFHDVTLVLPEEGRSIRAHRLILSAASIALENIFNNSTKNDDTGKVLGIKLVDNGSGESDEKLILEFPSDIKGTTFDWILEIAYTGALSAKTSDSVDTVDLKSTAGQLGINQLDIECTETTDGNHNSVVISALLKTTPVAECFKQSLFSDIVFIVKGFYVYAHRIVIHARCPRLADYIDSCITNGSPNHRSPTFVIPTEATVIEITNSTVEHFTLLLEYLYKDIISADGSSDLIGLMALANMYDLPRLVTLCEVQLRTRITLNTDSAIAIHLLRQFKTSKAWQLVDWCRHFISHNHSVFSEKKEYS